MSFSTLNFTNALSLRSEFIIESQSFCERFVDAAPALLCEDLVIISHIEFDRDSLLFSSVRVARFSFEAATDAVVIEFSSLYD